jgi:phosphoribosylamine--glycine ligase
LLWLWLLPPPTRQVFHAGTARNDAGEVVASGGRVLGITALAPDVASAQAAAYQGVAAVQWDDAYYRKDIGWRAVAREKANQGR